MLRRTFLVRLTQFCSAALAALISLPVFRFLAGSFAEAEQSGWYAVARTRDLTEPVTRVEFSRLSRDGWLSRTVEGYVWVRKQEDGSFKVFEPHCTHLGCAYSWNPEANQFQCPCHNGKFNIDGAKVDGPPPRPLDQMETQITDGILKVGKVKKT